MRIINQVHVGSQSRATHVDVVAGDHVPVGDLVADAVSGLARVVVPALVAVSPAA